MMNEPITHPDWCDRDLCTAPKVRPTLDEDKKAAKRGQHRSATLAEVGYPAEEVYLVQPIAPWECNTYLHVAPGWDISLETNAPLLRAILTHVDELQRDYPTLMESEATRRAARRWELNSGGTAWRPLSSVLDPELPEPRTVAGEPGLVLHAPMPIGSGTRGAPLCGVPLSADARTALMTRDVSCVDCLVILGELEDTAERWRVRLTPPPVLPISEESRLALDDVLEPAPPVHTWRPCADCLAPDFCEVSATDMCP